MNEETKKALELAREAMLNFTTDYNEGEIGSLKHYARDMFNALAAIDAALSAPAAPVAQPREPLTYDQIVDALVDGAGLNLAFRSYEDDMKFARAIERAHRIGQGGAA